MYYDNPALDVSDEGEGGGGRNEERIAMKTLRGEDSGASGNGGGGDETSQPSDAGLLPQEHDAESKAGDRRKGPNNNFLKINSRGAEEDARKSRWKSRFWPQHLAAILATLSSASVGYVDGWTANALPFLTATRNSSATALFWESYSTAVADANCSALDNHTLANVTRRAVAELSIKGISPEEASWLSSLVAVGALAASLPAGALADALGRKWTLMLSTFPAITSWIIILLASDSVEVRGALGVYQNMMVAVGLLAAYVCGALWPFEASALAPCVFPLATWLFFSLMPESPVHLLATGDDRNAHKALRFLRGAWVDVGREAAMLQPLVLRVRRRLGAGGRGDAEAARRRSSCRCVSAATATALRHLREAMSCGASGGRRGLLIAFTLMVLRQLSGVNPVAFHAVELLSGGDAGREASAIAARGAIALGAVEVVATFAASRVVDRVGRRPLLQLSSAGTAVCHGCLALYFLWASSSFGARAESLWWLPLCLLSAFNVIYSLGLGPLPWLMMAELIPTEDKKWASGLTGFLNWAFMFIVLKAFAECRRVLGLAFTFGLMGGCCAAGAVFVTAFVPETKGKTLDEIQGEMRMGPPSAPLNPTAPSDSTHLEAQGDSRVTPNPEITPNIFTTSDQTRRNTEGASTEDALPKDPLDVASASDNAETQLNVSQEAPTTNSEPSIVPWGTPDEGAVVSCLKEEATGDTSAQHVPIIVVTPSKATAAARGEPFSPLVVEIPRSIPEPEARPKEEV